MSNQEALIEALSSNLQARSKELKTYRERLEKLENEDGLEIAEIHVSASQRRSFPIKEFISDEFEQAIIEVAKAGAKAKIRQLNAEIKNLSKQIANECK